MNSWLRSIAQSYVAASFARLGGTVEGGCVLEVGCGGGVGARLILERFGASQVVAVDLDPEMVQFARRRLSRYASAQIQLSVGDATTLSFWDKSFDAVFDFGAIHLERNWHQAIVEIARVLKPGGRFFFELVTSAALRLPYPLLTEGFDRMDAPSHERFLLELERNGILVGRNYDRPRMLALSGWVGDFIGVGRRS